MEQKPERKIANLWGGIIATIALIAIIVAVWLDYTTALWRETVILSGIAAGLLTFVLTAFFIERWMDRREHKSWLPVTRLALTDLLHTVCDDTKSDIRRGKFVVRTLEMPEPVTKESLEALLVTVVEERDTITNALARWASFLSASADVQTLMTHLAYLSEGLDILRDVVLETEDDPSPAQLKKLQRSLDLYDNGMSLVLTELQSQISTIDPVIKLPQTGL